MSGNHMLLVNVAMVIFWVCLSPRKLRGIGVREEEIPRHSTEKQMTRQVFLPTLSFGGPTQHIYEAPLALIKGQENTKEILKSREKVRQTVIFPKYKMKCC